MTAADKKEKMKAFFEKMDQIEPEVYTGVVEKHLDDEDIDQFIQHLEEFYGIEDEEELGTLTQIMITGYLLGKNEGQSVF